MSASAALAMTPFDVRHPQCRLRTLGAPFTEYYGWIPLFSVDGADIAHLIPEDAQWRLKAQAGRSGLGIPIGDSKLDVKADDLVTLTVSHRTGLGGKTGLLKLHQPERGGTRGRRRGLPPCSRDSTPSPRQQPRWRPPSQQRATDLRRQLSFKNAHELRDLGAVCRRWSFIVRGPGKDNEQSQSRTHGTMGYVAIGYRTGDWTPFMAVSATRPGNGLRSAKADAGTSLARAPPRRQRLPCSTAPHGSENLCFGTLGFPERAALKVQWDITHRSSRVRPGVQGSASRPAEAVPNQLTLTLDFLFWMKRFRLCSPCCFSLCWAALSDPRGRRGLSSSIRQSLAGRTDSIPGFRSLPRLFPAACWAAIAIWSSDAVRTAVCAAETVPSAQQHVAQADQRLLGSAAIQRPGATAAELRRF